MNDTRRRSANTSAPPRPQCAQQLTAPCAAIRTTPRRTSAARKIRLSMQSDGERQKSEWHAPAKCDYDAPPRHTQQLTAPKFARFRDAPAPRRKIRLGDCALLPRKSKMWFCSLYVAQSNKSASFSLQWAGKKVKCGLFSVWVLKQVKRGFFLKKWAGKRKNAFFSRTMGGKKGKLRCFVSKGRKQLLASQG